MKIVRKLSLVALVLALVMVACVSEPPEAPEVDEPAESDDTAEDVAPATEESEEPEETEAPADEPTPEPEEDTTEDMEPIYVGGIHPMTGALAADGIQMDNAIKMAIDEINAAGGVLGGRQLEYLSSDSTGSPEVGQTEAERLIGEGAVALIGTFQSSVTANVAAIADREQVPLIIDVAVADAILDQGYTYVFRVQPNATSMGVNGARYLSEIAANADEEVSTAAYLFEGTTGYGDSVRAAFATESDTLGIEILGEFGYDPFGVTDLTTEMTSINALAPDVLLVTGYYNDGLLAAQNAEDVALNVKAVYGVAQGTYDLPQFVTDAGDLSQCFMDSNYHWDASNPAAQEVRDAFQGLFGEEMRTAAVLSYQNVYLLVDAIERAGSADPTAIRDALAETNYEDHILPYLGPIAFDETGENINASPVVMQVQDGVIYQVWPHGVAERDPIFPCVSWGE